MFSYHELEGLQELTQTSEMYLPLRGLCLCGTIDPKWLELLEVIPLDRLKECQLSVTLSTAVARRANAGTITGSLG
jgi:hypothetical protein